MTKLKDIAEASHVSVITVSRAINQPEKLKAETRKRIEEIMTSMAYIPNMAAKNLAAKRSGIIDIYIPEYIDLGNPFMMHFIVGVSEVLSDHMYSFLVKRSWAKEHSCDGYVVTGLFTDEIDEFYSRAKVKNRPVVLFGHTDIEEVDWYDVDNVLGGEMAVDYLIQNNHRKIAMINTDENKDYTLDRYTGYAKALQKAGIGVDPRFVIKAPNTLNGGKSAVKELFARGNFTAIFCAADPLAVGAVNAIIEAGLRVPEDISIIGFDGLGQQFLSDPHITSIRQPVAEVGKILAETLINRIKGNTNRTSGYMPPELLLGKSVKNKADE
ncbi:MAG: LacI family transcriptional regulator [Spirochaetaceae bacterium]|nr:LacI family transcriptional regulator [Spirochaetaceae bacterium]